MCGGVWELVGCIEVRDLGYDLPACIDRLGGFQQHSEQKRRWFWDFGHSFRTSYSDWRGVHFSGGFFYSSRKVFLEPVLNSRALGALPVYF